MPSNKYIIILRILHIQPTCDKLFSRLAQTGRPKPQALFLNTNLSSKPVGSLTVIDLSVTGVHSVSLQPAQDGYIYYNAPVRRDLVALIDQMATERDVTKCRQFLSLWFPIVGARIH